MEEHIEYQPNKRVKIAQDDSPEMKKQKVRPMTAQERELYKKQQEFVATTRWLPDTAFTTYYGKPAFHAYGKSNTKPTNPNQKMLTHNINAATGKQNSEFYQVYDSALLAGINHSKGVRIPKIPKQK